MMDIRNSFNVIQAMSKKFPCFLFVMVAGLMVGCQLAGKHAQVGSEVAAARAMIGDSDERGKFVVVGEEHGNPPHHAFQRRLLADLGRTSRQLAVGVEMLDVTQQQDLDAFLRGDISWKEFERRTDFAERWGAYTREYEKILRWCRRHAVPVVALNVPREVTRALAAGEKPDPGHQALLPDYTPPAGAFAHFTKIMPAHGSMDDDAMRRYFKAQSAWDQAMSARALEWMAATDLPTTMVILTGRAHANPEFAIPYYLQKYGRNPIAVFLPAPRREEESFVVRNH